MRVRFLNYYREISGVISAGGTEYGNYLGYAGTVLAQKLDTLGITITRGDDFDVVVLCDLDQELFDFACALPARVKKILVLAESPVYTPFAHHINVLTHAVWDGILSYNREFCSERITHYDIAVTGTQCHLPSLPPLEDISTKGVFVGSCKRDMRGYGPQRDALIELLGRRGLIDIYGVGWSQIPGYCGPSPNKIASIAGYAYTIAIENAKYCGYVTKEIGDSILAERPCLYFGDASNAKRRFGSTFVELKDLTHASFVEAKEELESHYEALCKAVVEEKANSCCWIDSYVGAMCAMLAKAATSLPAIK